jgi:hypothetical protein
VQIIYLIAAEQGEERPRTLTWIMRYINLSE